MHLTPSLKYNRRLETMKRIRSYVLALLLPALGVTAFEGMAAAKSVTRTIYVSGMDSGEDVKRVSDALKQVPGVSNVEPTQATMDVTFDDEQVTLLELEAAVVRAGDYEVVKKAD
jgi:copper chaperone CopZ